MKTTFLIIGSLLMGLYQYWVFSTFWVSEKNVENVSQAVHFAGGTTSIECIDNIKDFGQAYGSFYIKLEGGQVLDFRAHGTIRDCETFYMRFDEIFKRKRIDSNGVVSNTTKVGEQLYSLLMFDGYFFGKRALEVSFDDYIWLPYDEMKSGHRGLVFGCL